MTLSGLILKILRPLCVCPSRGLTLSLCPLTSWRSRWRINLPRVGQSSSASWGSSLSLSRGCWKNMLLGKTHTPYTFMQRLLFEVECSGTVFVIISSLWSCGSFPTYTSPHGQWMRWMWVAGASLNLMWPSDFSYDFINHLYRQPGFPLLQVLGGQNIRIISSTSVFSTLPLSFCLSFHFCFTFFSLFLCLCLLSAEIGWWVTHWVGGCQQIMSAASCSSALSWPPLFTQVHKASCHLTAWAGTVSILLSPIGC